MGLGGRLRRAWPRRATATLPPEWGRTLEGHFAHWGALSAGERERMRDLIEQFLRTVRFEAAHGFQVDDTIRLLIAAQASLLLLGLELDEFPGVRTVIVHPSTMVQNGHRATGVGAVVASGPMSLLGQAHYGGPVLIAWSAAARGARHPERGANVVYHEFAHKLDMLDGIIDGTPPLDDDAARARWVAVCTAAYDAVRDGGGSLVLRPYAGVNPGEFFAVATEVFFSVPVELHQHEPALYAELAGFYRQDPAARLAGR
jgi:MtfA peptidase